MDYSSYYYPYLATNGSIGQLFGLLYQLLSHILFICIFKILEKQQVKNEAAKTGNGNNDSC